MCAAVGGGILADLLAGRPAAVIQRGPCNATAALVGASVYVAADALQVSIGVSQAAGFIVVVAMLIAQRRRNGEPGPPSGDDASDGS